MIRWSKLYCNTIPSILPNPHLPVNESTINRSASRPRPTPAIIILCLLITLIIGFIIFSKNCKNVRGQKNIFYAHCRQQRSSCINIKFISSLCKTHPKVFFTWEWDHFCLLRIVKIKVKKENWFSLPTGQLTYSSFTTFK